MNLWLGVGGGGEIHKAKLRTLRDREFNPGHWAQASASPKTSPKGLEDKVRATEGAHRHPSPSQNCNKEGREGGKERGRKERRKRRKQRMGDQIYLMLQQVR